MASNFALIDVHTEKAITWKYQKTCMVISRGDGRCIVGGCEKIKQVLDTDNYVLKPFFRQSIK